MKEWTTEEMHAEIAKTLSLQYDVTLAQAEQMRAALGSVITEGAAWHYIKEHFQQKG